MAKVLILDLGSTYTKLGLATREEPTHIFPTLVGEPRYQKLMTQREGGKKRYFGKEVIDHSGVLNTQFPIQRGQINDLELFTGLLTHGIEKVNVDPHATPALFAYPPILGRSTLETVAEILFEQVGVPSLVMCSHPYLLKQNLGGETGLIIESGGGLTSITPVINGREQLHLSVAFRLAGEDITKRLGKLLEAEDIRFGRPSGRRILRDMKEKSCYFKLKEGVTGQKKAYTLPDGREIELGDERFKSPEVMYHPREMGIKEAPLQEKILSVLEEIDIPVRPKIVENILLSGGNTLLPNFKERLLKELREALTEKMAMENLAVSQAPTPVYSVWQGGVKIASPSTFNNIKTTKNEWETKGSLY